MKSVTLAVGGPDDLGDVVALMRAAFDPRYGEAWTLAQTLGVLGMPGTLLLLAQRGRRLLGFALARTVLDECELMLLAVDPQARRLGLGRRLLDELAERARAGGARALHLEVRKGNSAELLYLGQGFTLVGTRPRYYRGATGEVFDAQTYSRPLA